MSEQLKESLSAVMDDEADAFELRRLIDEAAVDEGLREQWHRYHLVSDLLRARKDAEYRPALRESMWAELNSEPAEQLDSAEVEALPVRSVDNIRNPWWGRAAGFLVATVVAGVVAFNGGVFDSEPQQIAANPSLPGVELPEVQPVLYSHFTDADRARLNGRMLRHMQTRAMNQNGLASFVKVATFENSAPRVMTPPTAQQSSNSQNSEVSQP